jgi:hypothetical protein
MGAIPTAGAAAYSRRWRSATAQARPGIPLLTAAAGCLAGLLLPGWYAVLLIPVLLGLGLATFALRRAARQLDRILSEELTEPPADHGR